MTRPDTTRLADFEPLRHAELALLRACARGDIARIGLRRPAERDARVSIRASFLAFLARGGDAFTPVRGRRIQLLGAWVEGRLDLGGAVVPLSLWFYRCVFEAEPLFDGAKVQGGLAFPDCELPGLLAEGCHVELDLALNAGCSVAGELRLRRVQVGGDLICTRLRMHGDDNVPSRRPLVADGARIEGDVRLGSSPEQGSGQGLESHGEVRFVGAHVGGDFHAGQARVTGALDARGARQAALVLDRIRVAGSVFLNTGFAAAGRVCLRRARIDGDVDCTAASFDMLGDASWGQGVALVLDRAEIGGELRLRDLSGPLLGASLAEARVGTLVDDASTWGERLVLDGFKYARFGSGAPVDAAFRLAWLGQQEPAHLQRDDMRLQPWQRVIAVLRRMGHSGAAVQVALRRERWLRRIGQVGDGSNVALRWVSQIGHRLWGALAGYGYRPQRLLGWGVLVWLLCAAVFAWAAREGWMVAAPASAPLPAGIDALAYSLDRLLPLVDLQQASAWSPSATAGPADALRWLGRLETLFGWVLLSMVLVSLAGWTERDRYHDHDRDHPQR